jgi:hypothetical protein
VKPPSLFRGLGGMVEVKSLYLILLKIKAAGSSERSANLYHIAQN